MIGGRRDTVVAIAGIKTPRFPALDEAYKIKNIHIKKVLVSEISLIAVISNDFNQWRTLYEILVGGTGGGGVSSS